MNGLIRALFSFCVAGMIVTVDTAVWVFIIMVAPAPFIFSGLVEVVLDYRIIRNLISSHTVQGEDQPVGLDRPQRVQLLTTVLAGNLGIEGVPHDPQTELDAIFDIKKYPQEVKLRLGAMLVNIQLELLWELLFCSTLDLSYIRSPRSEVLTETE